VGGGVGGLVVGWVGDNCETALQHHSAVLLAALECSLTYLPVYLHTRRPSPYQLTPPRRSSPPVGYFNHYFNLAFTSLPHPTTRPYPPYPTYRMPHRSEAQGSKGQSCRNSPVAERAGCPAQLVPPNAAGSLPGSFFSSGETYTPDEYFTAYKGFGLHANSMTRAIYYRYIRLLSSTTGSTWYYD
jgi:hypothetical protein